MIKLSVVITVYNAGEYLQRCLSSLSNQTLRDIEIILVLDCPTDGSDKVAKNFAINDRRFKVISNSKNLHIGESRNRGIQVCEGEYITFFDHDDFCDECMLEVLYAEAKKQNSDIVFSILSNYNEQTRDSKLALSFDENSLNLNSKEQLLEFILGVGTEKDICRGLNQVHGVIYRKSVLDKYNIRFGDTRKYLPEDSIFNIFALIYSANVSILPVSFYYHSYTGNNTGISLSYYDWYSWYRNFEVIYNLLYKEDLLKKYRSHFSRMIVRSCIMLFAQYLARHRYRMYYNSVMFCRKSKLIVNAFRYYSENTFHGKFKFLYVVSKLIVSN